MTATEHEVVIVGAGPAGVMLAAELVFAGIDVVVLERRRAGVPQESRARGLHARTLEVLDQRGIVDRVISAGTPMQVQGFAGIPLDISDFPSRRNHGLALAQREFERILAEWAAELGVAIEHEQEVTGVTQDAEGVVVSVADGPSVHAAYVVGCDGGRSVIRRSAGIDFTGSDASMMSLIAEAEVRDEPQWGMRYDANGTQAIGRADDGVHVTFVVTQPFAPASEEPTLDDLRRALVSVWGTDFGVHSPTRLSRFTDATRQAVSYLRGRVLLAGDAAHVHYPVGGQGVNLGVQDAVNLGWKLAQVVRGRSSPDLLDTYHAERQPVAARLLQTTLAQTALTRSDARLDALRDTMRDLLRDDQARKQLAGIISGLGIRYDLGDGHPLLGRRMPDLDVGGPAGAARVFSFLHHARPVLLNFTDAPVVDVSGWRDRVQTVDVTYGGAWELPVVGALTPPSAVLVRPDGYVAWVGEPGDPGLTEAITTWFGSPGA